MFERFSESARRVLFFARDEARQLGGLKIEPEHLVLAVLRGNSESILRFARPDASAEALRSRLADPVSAREKVATSVEIPFSSSCKEALAQSAFEADALTNVTIRPEHMILAIMVRANGAAARALQDAGVDSNAIREYLRGVPDDPQELHVAQAVMSAHTVSTGVIRQWKGVVKPGLADKYISHLRRETLPSLSRLAGFVDASILRREVEDGTEFQVSTFWRSLDAIKAFAGDDVTKAVVPPAAQALMVRYDDRAVHYEIVE